MGKMVHRVLWLPEPRRPHQSGSDRGTSPALIDYTKEVWVRHEDGVRSFASLRMTRLRQNEVIEYLNVVFHSSE
jgi:hypothetical protein